jgi:HD-like signal output (HDOD) protein
VEFGLRAEVESIRHALAILGLERVSSLSFTIAMKFYMRNTPRRQVIHPVWSHSVASGLIAETLGDALRNPLKSLYTAGLLHEVGRLGLLMSEGAKYEALMIQVHNTLEDANALEKETFGVTHAEAGGVMTEAWGIPASVCGSIRQHHDTVNGDRNYTELAELVRLSCRIAAALGYPEHNCRQRESIATVMESVPPSVRAHPTLVADKLGGRIKRMLGSVW